MPTPQDEFVEYCLDLLRGLGDCRARKMFGGYGISLDGLTFGIMAWERLYLKTDAQTAERFVAAGCEPFEYQAKGRTMRLGYHTAPAEALESAQAMLPWARLALEVALRARAATKPGARAPQKAHAARAVPAKTRARSTNKSR